MESTHPDPAIDSKIWEHVIRGGEARFYRHRRTGWPLCVNTTDPNPDTGGGGLFVFFKPPGGPQPNAKVEIAPKQLEIAVNLVEAAYAKVPPMEPEREREIWASFEAEHAKEMQPKVIILEADDEPPRKKRRKLSEEFAPEEGELCSICLEREANTTTSCAHTVVCQQCSDEMKDKKGKHYRTHCVFCGQELTAILESDNSVRPVLHSDEEEKEISF